MAGPKVKLKKGGGGEGTPPIDPAVANAQTADAMIQAVLATDRTAEEVALAKEHEQAQLRQRWSIGALVTLVLVVGAGAAGSYVVLGDEVMREQWALFWEGKLKEEADKKCQADCERKQKEDLATMNRYGEINLFYSPRDAKVKVTKVIYKETIPEFMERYERGGEDKRQPGGEEPLKQVEEVMGKLKGNSYFENLPLHDLGVLERSEDNTTVFTYEYKVEITHTDEQGKNDYKPRSYLLHSQFSYHPPPAGWTPLRFQEVAGNQFVAPFNGCNLIPEPTVFKCMYAETMYKVKCEVERARKAAKDLAKEEKKEWKDWTPEEEATFRANSLMETSGVAPEEWQQRVDELKGYTQVPEAWTQAQEIPEKCECDAEVEIKSPDGSKETKTGLDACDLWKGPPDPSKPPKDPKNLGGYCKSWKKPL